MAVGELREFFRIVPGEPADFPFPDSDVAQLHRVQRDPARASIDDATWDGLLLGPYCAELSREVSIFGQQVLYQRLREGQRGDGALLKELAGQPERAAHLRTVCKPMRHADREIASLLFDTAAPVTPKWVGYTWALPLLLAAAGVASIWVPALLVIVAALTYFLISNQLRYDAQVEEWKRLNKSLQMLLRAVSLNGGANAAQAGRINRALSRKQTAAIPALGQYLDWFALDNVNHYFRSWQQVERHREFLQQCMQEMGALEADVALARHLAEARVWCWSAASDPGSLTLEGALHPLLPGAQPLPVSFKGGVFISGQNGIGKSTLLRTIGINLVTARAFGFCYAARAALPLLPVYASMQSEDSMLGGESLYMAELRRARELLAAADSTQPGVYIIDEIFRGTNHLESVSAAAAVLDVLAARGLVVVSSHNLVLASLLAHRLRPLCVARDGAGRLTLGDGVLAHTNGIALLAQQGFGAEVESRAARVFDWLDGYLAHPPHADAVLGPREARRA